MNDNSKSETGGQTRPEVIECDQVFTRFTRNRASYPRNYTAITGALSSTWHSRAEERGVGAGTGGRLSSALKST